MAALDQGDSVLVTVNGRLNEQRTMNTFWYRVTQITDAPDEAIAFAALFLQMTGAGGLLEDYLACVPTNWTAEAVWFQSITPIRQRKVSFPWDAIGGGPSSALTANVQGSITRVGDAARREAIGGVRIPIGTGVGSITNGRLVAGQKAAMQDLADSMAQVIATFAPNVEYTPIVGKPNAAGNYWNVVDATVQDTVRVLRRRTVGLGI